MQNKLKIIYIGPFLFPNGGAAARRILGNAMSFRDAGCEVVIASGQMRDGVVSEYEGFEVVSLEERTAERYPRYLKHLFYLSMGKKSIEWLNSLEKKPDMIVLYSGYTPYLMKLIPWCKDNGVKFVFDAVEWYDPKSFWHGVLSPYQWNIEIALRYYSKKTQAVIAISSFLEKHYRTKGCEVVKIPPTLDMKKVIPNLETYNDVLTLSYTGTPGHKDLFNEYLEAVLQISEEGGNIRFCFAGVTIEQLVKFEALQTRGISKDDIPKVLDCRGVTTQKEAMDITKNADFSLLLRRVERYAQAGFPTKVVESLSMGTPVICNLTSDLKDYITHKQDGLICDEPTVESLKQSIKEALLLTKDKKQSMRQNARDIAQKSFDYRCYIDIIKQLVNSF